MEEHGIGWVQKDFMDIAFRPEALDLQRAIKKTFDPNGILNPGKMFPSLGIGYSRKKGKTDTVKALYLPVQLKTKAKAVNNGE